MKKELRRFWSKIFSFNWKFGLFLILIVCIPRFILVLKANASGNYRSIGLVMVISVIAPFVFLTKYGRNKIGLTPPAKYRWLLFAFVFGLISSLMLYYLGQSIYGNNYENWYHYIGKSYKIPAGVNGRDKVMLFTAVALAGMIFSPLGEELFFRGIVHASFAKSIGEKNAPIVDGFAFALVHISHFGLVYLNDRWKLLILPTIIWISAMFFLSLVFSACRKYSGSILGSIVCHAAFNLGMIYCIFYLL